MLRNFLSRTLFLLGAIVSCAQAAETLRIGYIGGMTGECGEVTHSARKATEIALEEINRRGGVLGNQVEIFWRDSETRAPAAVRQAIELIRSHGVHVLTGVCSSTVLAAVGEVAQEFHVPLVSAISSTYKTTAPESRSFVVQTRPNILMEAKALARYAASRDWKNIGTIAQDTEWGRTTANVFATELMKLNPAARVTEQVLVPTEQNDLSAYVSDAVQSGMDLILIDLYADATKNFVVQAEASRLLEQTQVLAYLTTRGRRQFGRSIPKGVHTWTPAPIEVLTTHNKFRLFADRYRSISSGDTPDEWAVLAYDAMHIIASAVEAAGTTDGESIYSALGTRSFSTLRGDVMMREIDSTFDAPTYVGVLRNEGNDLFSVMSRPDIIPGTVTLPDWGPFGPYQNTKCPPHC